MKLKSIERHKQANKPYELNTSKPQCVHCGEEKPAHFATHFAEQGWGDKREVILVCYEYIKNNPVKVLRYQPITGLSDD